MPYIEYSMVSFLVNEEALALYNRVQNTWGFWIKTQKSLKVVGGIDDIETVKAVFETVGVKPIVFQLVGGEHCV